MLTLHEYFARGHNSGSSIAGCSDLNMHLIPDASESTLKSSWVCLIWEFVKTTSDLQDVQNIDNSVYITLSGKIYLQIYGDYPNTWNACKHFNHF